MAVNLVLNSYIKLVLFLLTHDHEITTCNGAFARICAFSFGKDGSFRMARATAAAKVPPELPPKDLNEQNLERTYII